MSIKLICAVMLSVVFSTVSEAFAQSTKPGKKVLLETFLDAQNKPQYPIAEVYSPYGEWTFDGALLTPNEKMDIRPKSPRVLGPRSANSENGYISTNFDLKGLTLVKVGFIGFKADEGYFAVEVFVSKDQGKNWVSLGVRRGDPTKEEETLTEFKINNKGNDAYRVKIVNASAPKSNRLNRVNITEVKFEYSE
ncbi:MAG: hypothetical protein WC623_22925 [Pedobacter sp.]|uniref:hypothetical protein n=1 Tax=Pedobacter sp. TaxID=1411316 RepID=UPI003562B2BF